MELCTQKNTHNIYQLRYIVPQTSVFSPTFYILFKHHFTFFVPSLKIFQNYDLIKCLVLFNVSVGIRLRIRFGLHK